jgi:hypothetical protein
MTPSRNGCRMPMIIDVVGYRLGLPEFSLVAPSRLHTLSPPRGRGPLAREPVPLTDGKQARFNTEDTEKARRPRRSQVLALRAGV